MRFLLNPEFPLTPPSGARRPARAAPPASKLIWTRPGELPPLPPADMPLQPSSLSTSCTARDSLWMGKAQEPIGFPTDGWTRWCCTLQAYKVHYKRQLLISSVGCYSSAKNIVSLQFGAPWQGGPAHMGSSCISPSCL
jgi:hypothetical protein